MMDAPLLAALLGAAAVASFAAGLWLPALEGERRVRRRLGSFVEAPIGGFAASTPTVRRHMTRQGRASAHGPFPLHLLERFIADADSDVAPSQLALTSLVIGVLLAAAAFVVTRELLVLVAAAAAGAALPFWWLRMLRGRTVTTFKKQLPETIGLLASS